MTTVSPTTHKKRSKESGFSLVELLVVLLIIGVLAAIAIPIFQSQRDRAFTAQVETDLRNAATVMEDAYIDNSRYPANLPSTARLTDETRVYNDITTSGPQNYCLIGSHLSHPDIQLRYDSLGGGLLDDNEACTPATEAPDGSWMAGGGGSVWQDELNDANVLIVRSNGNVQNDPSSLNTATNALIAAGLDAENIHTDTSIASLASLQAWEAENGEISLVVSFGQWWSSAGSYENGWLSAVQAAGYNVLTNGQDDHAAHPLIAETTRYNSSHGGTAAFAPAQPSYNSINPPFPYLFSEIVSNPHSNQWNCILDVGDGAVSLASTTTQTDRHGNALAESRECHLVIAHVNNGKWVHFQRMFSSGQSGLDQAISSSLLWLMG